MISILTAVEIWKLFLINIIFLQTLAVAQNNSKDNLTLLLTKLWFATKT